MWQSLTETLSTNLSEVATNLTHALACGNAMLDGMNQHADAPPPSWHN